MAETVSQNQSPLPNGFTGSYFLQVWRNSSLALTPECSPELDEDGEEMPTALDTVNSSGGFSLVGPDKLSVSYPSVNLHGHDVGVVQANRAAPMKRLVYYFEILVKNAGAKGQIAIGFTTSAFKLRRQPGWEANSYGYHGDDGLLYRGRGKGETFGPTYSTGDIVGGGINYATQQFFFTKNGAVVGTVYKDVKGPVFPTVAVHSQSEEITVNFGKDPFVFDLKAYEADHRSRQQIDIEKISVPQDAGYGIVRSYLQHYGYEETLQLFDMASKSTVPPISIISKIGCGDEDSMYFLHQRRTLRQLIRSGQVDDAFAKIQEWYPQIIQDDASIICFLLHCQKFVELVREFGGIERRAWLVFTEKAGLDNREFLGAIRGGAAGSKALKLFGERMVERDFRPGGFAEYMVKDLGMAVDMVEEEGRRDEAVVVLPGAVLWKQLFSLMVANGDGKLTGGKFEDAVLYGRREFLKFRSSSDFVDLIKDCAALLAYEQPHKSSVGYLLRDSQRELVADAVNAMILSTNPNMKNSRFSVHSSLEMLIRQLTACFLEKRSLNGDQGEAFHLHRILESDASRIAMSIHIPGYDS